MNSFGRRDLLLYYDYAAHDETPLSVTVRTQATSNTAIAVTDAASGELVAAAEGGGRVAITGALADLSTLTLTTSATPQKLVQSHTASAMVVRTGQQHFTTFLTQAVCPLGLVRANTAACAYELQVRIYEPSAASAAFGVSARGGVPTAALNTSLAKCRWLSVSMVDQQDYCTLSVKCT